MKILLLSTYYGFPTLPDAGYGGMEKVNWFLARELARMGHQVTLAGCEGTVPPGDVEFLRYDVGPDAKPGIEQFARVMANDCRWDIIHDSTHDHWVAKAFRGGMRKRTVCTFHNPNIRDGAPNPIVLSQFQKSEPCDYGDARVVYNGVPQDYYPYCSFKRDYVVCIAVMAKYKGVLESVRAAVDAGVPIHLAGIRHDAQYWSCIEPYVHGGMVVWHGEVSGSEKSRLIGRARAVMLYVQWPEPGSLVGPEAMAQGTAIIGSDRGCIPEYVDHGKTGYICHDEHELADAINAAKNISPAICHERWESRFSAKRMADSYVEVYAEVLGGASW